MNIETIAKKLRPLMPERIDQLMKSRAFADPDLKTLIENEILLLAYQNLGNFERKILLSLPPEKKSKGTIELGRVLYEKEKWNFGISKFELMQNMAIFGRSGAGKTNISFHLLLQLIKRNVPFLYLDWKRTARHLLPNLNSKVNIYTAGRNLSEFVFNPFVVPRGQDPNVYLTHVIDVLSDAYTLGDGAKSVLQKAISRCYEEGNKNPLVCEIIEKLDSAESNQRINNWKITAKRALESIELSSIATTKSSQDSMIEKLFNQNTIIELDSLSQNVKEFIIPLLVLWVYQSGIGDSIREKLRLVVFVEEAHHVFYQGARKKETTMEMLLRQCREIGISTVIIDQQPSMISTTVLGNVYTTICLNQKSPGDISKAAIFSLVASEDRQCFSVLPTGWGIVKLQDQWTRPFLVKFPLVDVKKGMVSDDVLRSYLRTDGEVLFKPQEMVSIYDDPEGLDEKSLALLKDVSLYSQDSVQTRYKSLGFSLAVGHKVKERLIERELLTEKTVEVGKTRKTVLALTEKGRELLEKVVVYGNESIVHAYWKKFYARRLRRAGYEVREEFERRNGRIDLYATRNEESVAVEIETGNSNVVKNVMADLMFGCSKVVVVAVNEKALKKVEQNLARVGLLGMSRIMIVLKDEYLVDEGLDLEMG